MQKARDLAAVQRGDRKLETRRDKRRHDERRTKKEI
jgi:hypothetical protein